MDAITPQRSTVSEKLQAQIDKKIRTFEDAIRSLRGQRNTLAPVSWLPPELLSRIFRHARDAADGRAKILPPASHVCRAWRALALANPLLWTEIDCTRLRWAKEMMLRSQGAPLALQVPVSYHVRINGVLLREPNTREAIRLAFGAISNAKSLTMYDQYGRESLEWPDSSPLLETLDIAGSLDQPYDLPDAIVFGSFPQLRRVSLKHCKLTWNSPGVFRGLQDLCIKHQRNSRLLVPDLRKVLDVLQAMQSLQSLVISLEPGGLDNLSRETERISPHIPNSLAMVKLPQLAVLELGLNDLLLVALLSQISHPQERLKVTCPFPTVARASAVMRCIRDFRLFKRTNGHQMDAVYICQNRGWQLEVSDLSHKEERPALQLLAKIPDAHQQPIAKLICTELPFLEMTEVMVTSLNDLNLIHPFLDQCKTLCTSGWAITGRECFLEHQSFIREDGTRGMPTLDTLILHMMDMTQMPKTSKKPDRMTVPGFLRQLGDICPLIRQLKFFDCAIYAQEKLDVLRRQVQHFDRKYQPTPLLTQADNHIPIMQRLLR